MEYTVCFTGHRSQNLQCGFDEYHTVCLKIKHQLLRIIVGLIEKKHITHFVSGMAIGTDMWAAEIVLELKEEYPNITLEAAVPCISQENVWRDSLKRRYRDILSKCDSVTLLQEIYTSDCMIKRNRYMVDKSDYVVAVWNGRQSGTGNTVKYALSHNKPVYCIDAVTFEIRKMLNKN